MKQNLMSWMMCVSIFALSFTTLQAQDLNHCNTTDMQVKIWQEHPELWLQQLEYDAQIREQISTTTRDEDQVYIIPIVFHVIHNYGSEDISDAQVEDEVRVLNEDYRKLNPDTAAIVNSFLGIAADAKIEFRLAKKTTGGGCTNGIDRIVSHETYEGDDGSKLSQWPRNMYLNVWTVSKMQDGVAGYAYFPSTVTGFFLKYDGIMILSDYVGSIGTGNPGTTRALTHEIGHYLNLPHTWGLTNAPGVACGDDGVFDTPETKGWTSCNLSGSVCNPPIIENVQNYMEYAYCSKMFTAGQAQIMRGVLENTVAERNNLWTEENLIATGTNDGYVSECAPIADFKANHYFSCLDDAVTFTDYSWNGAATSWNWEFADGTPATSTDQNPSVTFNSAGTHLVTLTSSNAQGTSTVSKNVYINTEIAEYANYYYESFDNPSTFSNDWVLTNVDNNDSYWSLETAAGYSQSNSMKVSNFYGDHGDIDYAVSPSIDLSNLSEINLSFHYAGASSTSNVNYMDDELKIYSSTNCGESWVLRKTISGVDLNNNGAFGSYFVPSSTTSNTWSVATVPLSTSLALPNVRFKFEFVGGSHGNNFYIDDITISENAVGINDAGNEVAALNIFPNPNNGDFTLTYNLPKEEQVRISIVDVTGRELMAVMNEMQAAGNHQQNIKASGISDLKTGIYMVRLETAGQSFVKKLVIE